MINAEARRVKERAEMKEVQSEINVLSERVIGDDNPRLDLVDSKVIILGLQAVDGLLPVHEAQPLQFPRPDLETEPQAPCQHEAPPLIVSLFFFSALSSPLRASAVHL